MFRFVRSRSIAWLACCAVLLNALAPTVSYALARSDYDVLGVQVCRAAGSRAVPLGVDAAQPAGAANDGVGFPATPKAFAEHCPFCAPHAGSFALMPTESAAEVPRDDAASVTASVSVSPRPRFRIDAAQPRGPPFAS